MYKAVVDLKNIFLSQIYIIYIIINNTFYLLSIYFHKMTLTLIYNNLKTENVQSVNTLLLIHQDGYGNLLMRRITIWVKYQMYESARPTFIDLDQLIIHN